MGITVRMHNTHVADRCETAYTSGEDSDNSSDNEDEDFEITNRNEHCQCSSSDSTDPYLFCDEKINFIDDNMIIDMDDLQSLIDFEKAGIQNIISYLEKDGYIGDNPQKFWNNKQPEYKIEILNPELLITGEAIPASNQEIICMDRDPRNIPDLSNIMKGQSKRTFNRSDSGESSSTPPQIHIPQIQYPENVTAVTEPALKKLKIYDHEYSDFSDTTHGFNVIEKDQISRAQKVLIDNLWVAHKRNDRRHMIACLNDTVKMLIRSSPPTAKQIPAYVIYDGRIKGIFHSWAEVSYNTQSFKNAKFKKYTSLEEAYREASIYLVKPFHITPRLQAEIAKIQNASSSGSSSQNLPKIEDLEDHIQTLEATIQQLNTETEELRKERDLLISKNHTIEQKIVNLQIGADALMATEEQTPIEKVLSKIKHMSDVQEAMLSVIQAHDNRPSVGYDQWLEQFADSVIRPMMKEEFVIAVSGREAILNLENGKEAEQ
ncbi:hypothetical protein RJ639_000021 [Escallonia herrerae]|uniref:Ribonuclease H1 N-terminal domain-containing protein n=1 Tax=Escallonia herrerae TaxID=1293975 RepID=A0AA88XAK0_9ASTE|nr:hypothetical protein RJ639_000021 [Escallonia herrerae]